MDNEINLHHEIHVMLLARISFFLAIRLYRFRQVF